MSTCGYDGCVTHPDPEVVTEGLRRLLAEALHICMHGEYAPGGNENWGDWARKTEAYLRELPEE